jgi:hypothetical protein
MTQQYLGQIITPLLSMIIALIVFVLLPMYAVQAAKSSRWDHTLYLICGVFVLIADWIMNMMYQMACKTFYCHLRWLFFAIAHINMHSHILIIYIT